MTALVDELATLRLLGNRARFERYNRHLNRELLTDHVVRAVNDLGVYYRNNPTVDDVDWDVFATWWKHDKHASINATDRQMFELLIENVTKLPAPISGSEEVLVSAWAKAEMLTRTADTIVKARDGILKAPPDEAIEKLVTEYRTTIGKLTQAAESGESVYLEQSSVEYTANNAIGYNWRTEDLNVGLGPIRAGDFILVGGRPEYGKTSFIISETTHMLHGTDKKILWINNEEGGNRLMLRHLTCILNKTAQVVRTDLPRALQAIGTQAYGEWARERVCIRNAHTMSMSEIEALVEQQNPDILILHRLDKLPDPMGGKHTNDVQRLGHIALWARKMAAAPRVVIGVVQADTTASNQLFVYDNQLYGSKTLVPAESDAIITIGAEDPYSPKRGIHLPRNKLDGGPMTQEAKRHGFFEVEFDHRTGRYKSIVYAKGATHGKP